MCLRTLIRFLWNVMYWMMVTCGYYHIKSSNDYKYPGFTFKVYSTYNKARRGAIVTPHGTIQTPAFIFCATKATMKSTTMSEMKDNKTQIILSNTYHLFLRGADIIKKHGGLHKTIGWTGPILTDSGGYQVFAMNHGSVSRDTKTDTTPEGDIKGSRTTTFKPTLLKVTNDSAKFRCYYTKRIVELTPEKSIQTQLDLGSDIVVVFDECTSSDVKYAGTEKSMVRSHLWERRSYDYFMKHRTAKQALYGIVQGGVYLDLRKRSCEFNNTMPFFGIAVGGCLGKTKEEMYDTVNYTMSCLRKDRPVHLLGIGYIRDIFHGVRQGIDTFDCVHPSRIARHGSAYVPAKYQLTEGEKKTSYIDLSKGKFSEDLSPIFKECKCSTCLNYSRAYINLLIRMKETMGFHLITNHNVYFFNQMFEDIREGIVQHDLKYVEQYYIA